MNVTTKPAATGAAHSKVCSPSLAPLEISSPRLMSVDDAKGLSAERMRELYQAHINPGQIKIKKLLGFHNIKEESSQGK